MDNIRPELTFSTQALTSGSTGYYWNFVYDSNEGSPITSELSDKYLNQILVAGSVEGKSLTNAQNTDFVRRIRTYCEGSGVYWADGKGSLLVQVTMRKASMTDMHKKLAAPYLYMKVTGIQDVAGNHQWDPYEDSSNAASYVFGKWYESDNEYRALSVVKN